MEIKETPEDDPVEYEIPVYLSKALQEKLYLFQYPVRPRTRTYEDTQVLEAKIKPQQQSVELSFGVETGNPNYDRSRGEQIALNVDGPDRHKRDPADNYFASSMMDKISLSSSRVIQDASRYAIGYLQGQELHLSPVTGIVSLRPNFEYLDRADKKQKDESKDEEHSQDEEEEAKQVTVKFARQESDRYRKAREKSFGFLRRKSAEEPWYNTKFYHTASEEAKLERNKLFCTKPDEEISELNLSTKDFVSSLVPDDKEASEPHDVGLCSTLSLNQIRMLPSVDQVKTVLSNSKLVSYRKLQQLISPDIDQASVLRALQQAALLVQGNWIVRSEIVYPKDSISPICGVPAELMCRGRDYLLFMFTQHEHVNRQSLTSTVRLPPEEVKEMLMEIAKLAPGLGWKLKLPVDQKFIAQHQEIVQRQQMWWDAKQQQLSRAFKEERGSQAASTGPAPPSSSMGSPPKQRRRRSKSQRDSMSSDNESGTEGMEGSTGGRGSKQRRNSGVKQHQ